MWAVLQARPPADFVPGTVFRSSTNLVRITFLYLDPCGSLRYHIAVLAEPLIGSTGKLEAYSRTIYHIYSLGGLLCRRLASKKKINNMLHECLSHVPSCILSIAARTGPATLSQVHHKQNQGGGEHHEDPYYVYIMYIYIYIYVLFNTSPDVPQASAPARLFNRPCGSCTARETFAKLDGSTSMHEWRLSPPSKFVR